MTARPAMCLRASTLSSSVTQSLRACRSAPPPEVGRDRSGDLSAQIGRIVASALGAAAQPMTVGTLGEPTASSTRLPRWPRPLPPAPPRHQPSRRRAQDAKSRRSRRPPAPSNSKPTARERPPPARPRRALKRIPRHAAGSSTKDPAGLVSTLVRPFFSLSGGACPAVARATTAKAPLRPERSAAPRWPRPPDRCRHDLMRRPPGQSGGQGTPVPSLLAAVTGLLIIFGFHCCPTASVIGLPNEAHRSSFLAPRLRAPSPSHT